MNDFSRGGRRPYRSAEANCGHETCTGPACRVSYVGPVSHMRDHHMMHAARGVVHVWTAAIVSGLAVVVTGFLAYGMVQAREPAAARAATVNVTELMQRLDKLERKLDEVRDSCTAQNAQSQYEEQRRVMESYRLEQEAASSSSATTTDSSIYDYYDQKNVN